MRKPLARASTRYSGRSPGSVAVAVVAVVAVVAAEAGRSAVDEELAVRRGIDGLPPLMVGSAPQPTGAVYVSRPWTAGQQVGYGIQKATFIIREFRGEG
jgi:hypothetical protein